MNEQGILELNKLASNPPDTISGKSIVMRAVGRRDITMNNCRVDLAVQRKSDGSLVVVGGAHDISKVACAVNFVEVMPVDSSVVYRLRIEILQGRLAVFVAVPGLYRGTEVLQEPRTYIKSPRAGILWEGRLPLDAVRFDDARYQRLWVSSKAEHAVA